MALCFKVKVIYEIKKEKSVNCPCDSQRSYKECCSPFISKEKLPETPEQLMRSRYTAYVNGDIDYIKQTHNPKTVKDLDKHPCLAVLESAAGEQKSSKTTSVKTEEKPGITDKIKGLFKKK